MGSRGACGSGLVRRAGAAARELGEVTFVVMGIEGLSFLQGIEVGDVVDLLVEDLLLCETVRLCGLEDLSST